MIDEHAICHEAGHAVAAMDFGLSVIQICVEGSLPTTKLSTAGATRQQVCTVYAAGAAAEKIAFGGFGKAAAADRREILKVGGGNLEDYLDYAAQILTANTTCHKQIWKELSNNWLAEEGGSIWSGADSDKLDFVLLDGSRLREIWKLYHP
jgi:hypothetical protein